MIVVETDGLEILKGKLNDKHLVLSMFIEGVPYKQGEDVPYQSEIVLCPEDDIYRRLVIQPAELRIMCDEMKAVIAEIRKLK